MFRKTAASLAALALVASLAPAAFAQTAPQATPSQDAQLRAKGEAYSRAPDSEQNPAEVSTTAQLNAGVAARNDAADVIDATNAQTDADAEARYQAEVSAADGDAAAYAAARERFEAAEAEYQSARTAWEGLIRGCEASGRTDCRVNAPN